MDKKDTDCVCVCDIGHDYCFCARMGVFTSNFWEMAPQHVCNHYSHQLMTKYATIINWLLFYGWNTNPILTTILLGYMNCNEEERVCVWMDLFGTGPEFRVAKLKNNFPSGSFSATNTSLYKFNGISYWTRQTMDIGIGYLSSGGGGSKRAHKLASHFLQDPIELSWAQPIWSMSLAQKREQRKPCISIGE